MSVPTLTEKVNAVLKTLSSDIAEQKLQLPTPPDTLLELKRLVNTPQVKVETIVKLLRRDPNISARLIKVANSVLFGSRNHVTSVKSAVIRLGMNNVHSLVVGLTITQQFLFAKTKGLESYLKQAWHQSYQVAAISQTLAQHKTDVDPDNALLAGLVHNIGMLPLYMRLNSISDLRDDQQLLENVCHKVVPKLYAKAGSLITKNWNFSEEITEITRTHADLDSTKEGPITLKDVVMMAHQLYLAQQADNIQLSNDLVNGILFQKFWPDAESASQDMQSFAEEIADINNLMTNER